MTDYPTDNRLRPKTDVEGYKTILKQRWQKDELTSLSDHNAATNDYNQHKQDCELIHDNLILTVEAIEAGRQSSLSLKAATKGIPSGLDITAASISALHSCHHELDELMSDSGKRQSPEWIEEQKKQLFAVLNCIQQVNNPQKSAPKEYESTWPYIFAFSLGLSLINAVQTPFNYIMAAVFIVGICLIVQAAPLFPMIAVALIGAYVFGKMAYAAYTAVRDANQFANKPPNNFKELHTVLQKELTGLESNSAEQKVINSKKVILDEVEKFFKPASKKPENTGNFGEKPSNNSCL